MITFGSILDGAIFGDHCSPISDTTIMSSISSSSDHMHHVRTQLPYSLTVGTLALVCGYLPAGFGMPSWLGFVAAIAIIIGGFSLLSIRNRVPVS
jgi:Na+/H+ antiporter NhaC